MKIATYLMAALLIAALGAAALFYFSTFEPMLADYNRMKQSVPEFDRAKAELNKYRQKESAASAWIGPIVQALNAGLAEEIKAGKTEVSADGNGVVVNISEDILYTPRSVTFTGNEARPLLQKLATALGNKDLKGKIIIVGNTTDDAPARGRGKKRVPPKEARTLAAERSIELVKYLEKNKVDQETLVAAGYASKIPDTGFQIKDHKTMILVRDVPSPVAPNQSKQHSAQPQVMPKTIPFKPAQASGQ